MSIDVTVKVLEEPVSKNFLTLDEAKQMLGLATTGTPDPVADALLEIQIAQASAVIARLCNRQFARTGVLETWRDNLHATTYLRLWPVKDEDVFYVGGLNDPPIIWPPPPPPLPAIDIELENFTGKIRKGGDFSIGYYGGYLLPDEAPDDLEICVPDDPAHSAPRGDARVGRGDSDDCTQRKQSYFLRPQCGLGGKVDSLARQQRYPASRCTA